MKIEGDLCGECVHDIRRLVSGSSPNILRERIVVTAHLEKYFERQGWRLSRKSKLVVEVTIRGWTRGDVSLERMIEEFVGTELIQKILLPLNLRFARKEKKGETANE